MSSSMHRKVASRASLPRRTTRNPLDDDDDPLSATLSPASTVASSLPSPMAKSGDINPLDEHVGARTSLLDDGSHLPETIVVGDASKNLSFVLDAAIYHPLSQVDIPMPFRKPPVGPPALGATVSQILGRLDDLILRCDFLGAAHLAAMSLTSGIVQPTDHTSIFRLLAIRYSSLELIGQILLAAQEAKALEDLSSDFYYATPQVNEAQIEAHGGARPLAQHIMPFSLRVQAIRLQNIGFSDPRRGVTALYDLALEAREHLASPYTTVSDREVWKTRLKSLNVHVVNALVELGDVDCAQRTLTQSKPRDTEEEAQWASRMTLLLVKLGQLAKAQEYANNLAKDDSNRAIILSILATANGRIEEATAFLEEAVQQDATKSLLILARQNLAVAYLYSGRVLDARNLLQTLIDQGHSFQSLVVNLATVFDLTSDKSRDLKIKLVNKLADTPMQRRPFTNADFKL